MTDYVRLRVRTEPRFVALRMLRFSQLSAQFPALLIDAASAQVQVGVLNPDGSGKWECTSGEAGVAVFESIEKLNADPGRMGCFIFCDGPGSVLGIRTVAMALRTWNVLKPRPLYAYSSLALVAHALGRPEVSIISDARRESWHHYQLGRGLRRLAASTLSGELLMPEHFRHWSALPAGVVTTPYVVRDLLPRVWDVELLLATDAPDAFLHEEPSYVTWTPQIHRAPSL